MSHTLKSLDDAVVARIPRLNIPDLNGDNEKEEDENDDDSLLVSNNNDGIIREHDPLPSSPLFRTPPQLQTRGMMTPDTSTATTRKSKSAQHNLDWPFQEEGHSSSSWVLGYDNDDDEGYDDNDDDDDENQIPAPVVSVGLLTNSSAQNLQALLEQAAPHQATSRRGSMGRRDSTRSLKETTGDRVFAAPKYATAMFRLMFCLFSCLVGLLYFGGADFWPPAVGGHGNTKNCWDLGSVGATVLDSDFDHRNNVLRRYYLLQASYHFHSAAFHVLTSLLLWFVSATSKTKDNSSNQFLFLGFIPSGMLSLSNVRSFFQHCFSIAVILVTYLFSSTRRLGTIAMFAFDASSLFLHLLQLGINAPKQQGATTSKLTIPTSPASIRILHRVVVIPAFCYARFYVFPFVVAYSALEESQDWLRQLENMLIPGTAQYIHGFFVVAFLLFLVMNLIYFGRLLNHPHVMEAQT
jgi:hypothetical protein